MFWHITVSTSPQLPSRLQTWNKFSVDFRPDFPVPYFTLNEHLHILQQSFALSTTFFGVPAPSIKDWCCLKTSMSNKLSSLFTFSLVFIGWLFDTWRVHGELRPNCHCAACASCGFAARAPGPNTRACSQASLRAAGGIKLMLLLVNSFF